MTWVSFDDDYTQQAVIDQLSYEARWHYHAIVECCCRTRRWHGVLPWPQALRCSDVDDPMQCTKDLINVGLLVDVGAEVQVSQIEHHVPPEGQRDENLLPRKRKNQADYRWRKCHERGEHDRHCPQDCPARRARQSAEYQAAGEDVPMPDEPMRGGDDYDC